MYVLRSLEPRVSVGTTGRMTSTGGLASICIGGPAFFDTSNCSSNFTVRIIDGQYLSGNYSCTLNYSDPYMPRDSLSIHSNTTLFNITPSGLINFFPQKSMIGRHYSKVWLENTTCESILNFTLDIFFSNKPPLLVKPYPSPAKVIELQQYYTTVSWTLDDYFYDPNGDKLTNVVKFLDSHCFNINITIEPETNIVTYNPGTFTTEETGPCRAYYITTDEFYATNQTNIFNITVQSTPIVEPEDTLPTSGGGGGGGVPPPKKDCILQNVSCREWSKCMYNPPPNNPFYEGDDDGIMRRDCTWVTNCPDEMKPALIQKCDYIPTCSDNILNQGEEQVDCGGPCPACPTCDDGIRNQGEEGIDCGGPCPACPTCVDGILNQGEEQVDCGGPCLPCPTCDDGIRNQGEEGIDCGGPCKPCLRLDVPMLLQERSWLLNLALMIFAAALAAGLAYRYWHTGAAAAGAAAAYRSMSSYFHDKMRALRDRLVFEPSRRLSIYLAGFNDSLVSAEESYEALEKSALFREGEKMMAVSEGRTPAFSVMSQKGLSSYFMGATTMNFTVSYSDRALLRSVLAALHRMGCSYSVSGKLSSYLFTGRAPRNSALEVSKKGKFKMVKDRQLMLSIVPKSRREERKIIRKIEKAALLAPEDKLVWKYNNIQLYRKEPSARAGNILRNSYKSRAGHTLVVPGDKVQEGFDFFDLEVHTW